MSRPMPRTQSFLCCGRTSRRCRRWHQDCIAAAFLCVCVAHTLAGDVPAHRSVAPPPDYAARGWSTVALGGILPTVEALREMQAGDYVLRSHDSKISATPAEKTALPLDPCGHVQRLSFFKGLDGTLYAAQCSVLSRSSDGGKTWNHTSYEIEDIGEPEKHFMDLRVLADGAWVQAKNEPGRITLSISQDDGKSWRHLQTIGAALETDDVRLGCIEVLRDGSVVAAVTAIYWEQSATGESAWKEGKSLFFRSSDGGKSFAAPTLIGEWGHEINLTELPSGRLLAVIRYQRHTLPSDPPNILVVTGAKRHSHTFPYKHVFVSHSDDSGQTWSRLRQVTTEVGQCHGQAVGLTDNRVVVAYDHRYPRPMSGARAVVSDDDGETWRDEVYYLSNGLIAGFARTLTLDGEEMLTLTGTYSGEKIGWKDFTGQTEFAVIRWSLVD